MLSYCPRFLCKARDLRTRFVYEDLSCVMLLLLVWQKFTDVSEVLTASIIRATSHRSVCINLSNLAFFLGFVQPLAICR
jgi:hypothetical protein